MNRRGFVLLEAMLAVGIFSMGVLGLGYCINNCLNAESARADDQRARLALENRMAEIRAGAIPLSELKTQALKGVFTGMTMKQGSKPLKLQNEKKEPLDGLSVVDLEVAWEAEGEKQSRALSFTVYGLR